MISQTSTYAVRALAVLAAASGRPMSVHELARRAQVPPPFLGKIMAVLARRGIVSSKRGRNGGSILLRPASSITLYDVCVALEDPAILSRCLLGGALCVEDSACLAHSFWRTHQGELIRFLEKTTIQDVAVHEARRESAMAEPQAPIPHSTLRGSGLLTIVCGPSGSGKTTYCSQYVERARCARLAVAGILEVNEPADGERRRLLARDLRTGMAMLLAELVPPIGDSLRSGRWWFHVATIAWANQVLRGSCPCDVLVVDELGPLELRRGAGLVEALRVLDKREYGEALVTVRPSLLPILTARWPWASVLMLQARQPAATSVQSVR